MSIESVMPSNHLILCHPLVLPSIFPSIRVFPMSQLFASDGQSIGASASASVLPMNIQDWFPLGLTDWISLLSKGLLRVFSNTTIQKHQADCVSVSQFSLSVVSDSLWPHESQHARPPCPSPTPGVYPNSCPLSIWYNWEISYHLIMKNLLTSLLCTQNTFFHRSDFMVFRGFVRQSTKTYSIPSFQFCKSCCNCVSMEKAFVILPQNIRNTFGFTSKYFPEFFWLYMGIYSNWLLWTKKHWCTHLTVKSKSICRFWPWRVVWISLSIFGLSQEVVFLLR